VIELWCPERDLNPHALLGARDFKSEVSPYKNNNILILQGFYRSLSDKRRHTVRTKLRTATGVSWKAYFLLSSPQQTINNRGIV
jgi:hypothetical protein